jgi:hypothetical protein
MSNEDDREPARTVAPPPDELTPEPAASADAGRRLALGELGRLAVLAPALAVLFDPDRAQAY